MRYDQLLCDRTALIAGDPGPLRLAVASLFTTHGAQVALLGGQTGEGALPHYPADLSCGSAVTDGCCAALGVLGGADVFVNVLTHRQSAQLHTCSDDMMLEAWNRGVQATCLCMQQVVPGMMERRHGAVVHVLPIYARYTVPGVTATAGAAGGAHALSKAIAMDYCRYDIRSNCVLYSTGLIDEALQERPGEDTQPLPRQTGPAEIARAVLYLASDMSKHVLGETLVADGGATLVAHKQFYAREGLER